MSHKWEMYNPQMGFSLSHNREMEKDTNLVQVLAVNVTKLMENNENLNRLEKVAKKASVGRGTVDRVKNRAVSTTLGTVEKLAKAFGVSPIDLLTDDQTKQEATRESKLMELFHTLPPTGEASQESLLSHAEMCVIYQNRRKGEGRQDNA